MIRGIDGSNIIKGIDYEGGLSAATIKAAGFDFVCRYVSRPGESKNLTRAEADDILGHGLGLVTVFETTGRMDGGYQQGMDDAHLAMQCMDEVGAPIGAPVYFTADYDVSTDELPTVGQYLLGTHQVFDPTTVGGYGGLRFISYVLDNHLVEYGWQTLAWSPEWDTRSCIRQYSNGHTLGGVSVDYDGAIQGNYGQWGAVPAGLDDVVEYVSMSAVLNSTSPTEGQSVKWNTIRDQTDGTHSKGDFLIVDGGDKGVYFTLSLMASNGGVQLVEVDPKNNYAVTKTYSKYPSNGSDVGYNGCVSPGKHLWARVLGAAGPVGVGVRCQSTPRK